jgi:hypothetical protein
MTVGAGGEAPAPVAAAAAHEAAATQVPVSVRAQLLATEHWSLLATRSMTWSEVMSRISIHLTVLSASLVVLALVAQASGFGTPFRVLSIGLASMVLVLGVLTAVRVTNASVDDYSLLVGMNRLRAAYVAIDPTLADHLVTGWHDDRAGVMTTYVMGVPRRGVAHVLGSTNMFMTVVNSLVAGTLGALVAGAAGAAPAIVAVVGCLTGIAFYALVVTLNARTFANPTITPRFPTPGE